MPVLHQPRDDVAAGTTMKLGHELSLFVGNDLASLFDFAASRVTILFERPTQAVDVVEEYVVEVANRRLEIARRSKIEDECGATGRRRASLPKSRDIDDGPLGSRRAHDHVGPAEPQIQFRPCRMLATPLLRETLCP